MNEQIEKSQEPADHKKKRVLWGIALGFILIGLFCLLLWLFYLRFEETTTDSYVGGNQVVITAQIPGYVSAIYADDHDVVEEGQILVELDKIDSTVAYEEAKSRLAETVRNVTALFQKVGTFKAEREEKKAEMVRRGQDYAHRKHLIDSGSVSLEDLEHAEAAFIEAFAAVMMVEYQLREALSQVENTRIETHPLVENAKEEVKRTYVNLKRCTILSPARGQVARRAAQVGQAFNPQDPLMVVIPFDQMWVEANYKETQIKKMRLGQSVKMRSDTFGRGTIYHGKIIGISAGTGSVFSVLPPQNATGNWIKIVQRLPVRMSLEPQEIEKHPLRLGLSMTVKVNLHDLNGEMIPAPVAEKPIYETDIFHQQLEGVKEVIDEIVFENSRFSFTEEESP